MKKIISKVLVSALLIGALSGCGNTAPATKDGEKAAPKKGEYELRVGTVLTEKDPLYKGLELFQKNVGERTNGVVEVKLYASAQLGSDEDVLGQAKVGGNVGIVTDPGRMSLYDSNFGILGAPYLVDNYDEALKLVDTSVFKELEDSFAEQGFKILAMNYFQGTRHLFTKEPVTKPEDLSGLRVRSSGSKIVTSTVKNMGANPTVIPWSEAYSGLQQKVIDGVEVHYSAAVGSSLFEVTKNLSKTGHFQLLSGLVVSNDWFNKLPEEYQTIVLEEARNGGQFASEQIMAKEAEFEKTLVEKGMTINDCDVDAFKKATAATYDELGYRELKDRIDTELGK